MICITLNARNDTKKASIDEQEKQKGLAIANERQTAIFVGKKQFSGVKFIKK